MKLKKIASALLVLCMCAALCSCGGSAESDAPDGMKKADVGTKSYTVYIPESWTADMSTGTFSAYAGSTDASNVSVAGFAVEDTQTTLDSFWEKYSADFTGTFDTMKYLDENGEESDKPAPQKTTLGGFEANKYVYTARVTGEVYKFMQVTCIAAGNVYILTYTAVPETYDSHLTEVGDIISNFSFN